MNDHDPIAAEPPSGFQKHLGYRLTAWREGYAEMEIDIGPHLLNRNGLTHGGVYMTLLDVVCGYAVTWCAVPGNIRRTTTIAMTTTFLRSVRQGTLRAVGRVRGGGRKTVGCTGELFDDEGNLVAIAQGSYRYLMGTENPEGIPRPADDQGDEPTDV